MPILIAFTLFAVLAGAISYVGYRHYARPGRYYEQLADSIDGRGDTSAGPAAAQEGTIVHIVRIVGEKLPISPETSSLTRRYLIAAGFRSDKALPIYYGIKVIAATVLLALAFLVRDSLTTHPFARILIPIVGGLLGYFGPGFALDMFVTARQQRIKYALPDALDLMVVCVEAGLGLDHAVLSVAKELEMTHKDIADEFNLMNLEMQAGKRRADALRHLADRTGVDEIKKLVAILIQTDRFGTSMADSLRTHSDFMRIRRRQEAEERAAKVGVKLIFPIFLFILPALFVVVAAPALLVIFKQLLPLMRGGY